MLSWPRFGIIAYAARTRFDFGLDLKRRRGGKGAYKGKSGASQAQPADEKVQAGSKPASRSRNMKIFLSKWHGRLSPVMRCEMPVRLWKRSPRRSEATLGWSAPGFLLHPTSLS